MMRTLTFSLALGLTSLAAAQAPTMEVPTGNPITTNKVLLGHVLFWDEQLSSTGTVACGTCHKFEAGGSDPRARLPNSVNPGPDGVLGTADDKHGSPGVISHDATGAYVETSDFGIDPQVTPRKAPSVIDVAFISNANPALSSTLFWDGRAGAQFFDPIDGSLLLTEHASIENVIIEAPLNPVEMANAGRSWADVAQRIASVRPLALASDIPVRATNFIASRPYFELFNDAFGDPAITPARIIMAIATYVRTLVSYQSRWDTYLATNSTAGLTAQELRGAVVYLEKQCTSCHLDVSLTPGFPALGGNGFHNTGIRPIGEDPGREMVTGSVFDGGRFRAVNLRNVELHAPYFHNGGVDTLTEVLEFYERGGDFLVNQDPSMSPFTLTDADRQALVAFLKALTDPRLATNAPPFDRPTLYSDSDRVPRLFGVGTPTTSGGPTPRAISIEPPLLGNSNWTFGISDGPVGGFGVLFMDGLGVPNGYMLGPIRAYLGLTPGLWASRTISLGGVSGRSGSISLRVPDAPQLRGLPLTAQWIVFAPGPLQVGASEAFDFRLF